MDFGERVKMTPKSDDKMVEYNYDTESEDDFQINCIIFIVLSAEYDRVSEVSKTKEDYIQDEASNQNPWCYSL